MGVVEDFEHGKDLEKTILSLEVGEHGWASVEALELYHGFDPVLDLNYLVFDGIDLESRITLYVERIGSGKDDFLVRTKNAIDNGYKWVELGISDDDYESYEDDPEYAILKVRKKPKLKTIYDALNEAVRNENYELAATLRDKIKREEGRKKGH